MLSVVEICLKGHQNHISVAKYGEDYLMPDKWMARGDYSSGAKFVLQVKHPIGTGSPGPLARG
jgi:hypothetical protein